ncbi:uncharacterized protein STEHIDRAFT_152395 [Stereum hirsutum FP-91666 SS1]|uniref:uncharacterized protein n=1 Tax=Stereum hirsutum (strain FP-91666) TaxID=721885 RepID=UPI000440C041|nr:uncharacterized protein STEHIDRAFT_152395 [Stereum hirsutum FP-91666 SS1]EIM90687.1 hypothetical protein STEHIDRAFT_152395 [Stereum hirsutum FP-91666 SS1]
MQSRFLLVLISCAAVMQMAHAATIRLPLSFTPTPSGPPAISDRNEAETNGPPTFDFKRLDSESERSDISNIADRDDAKLIGPPIFDFKRLESSGPGGTLDIRNDAELTGPPGSGIDFE